MDKNVGMQRADLDKQKEMKDKEAAKQSLQPLSQPIVQQNPDPIVQQNPDPEIPEESDEKRDDRLTNAEY